MFAQLEATLPFLPPSVPLLFFYIHCTFEIHAASDGLHDVIDELDGVFEPESLVVRGLRASVYYHLRGACQHPQPSVSLVRCQGD